MVNSALVQHFSRNVIPGTICGDPKQKKSTFTTETRGTAPLVTKTNTYNGEGVREVFLSQGFDNDTVYILMAIWRKCTFCNSSLYMGKWFEFASRNKVSLVEPPVQVELAFLTSLVRQGKSLNQICMSTSALSSVINQQQNFSFGNIPIVKRYMKGISENNPTLAKFQLTWNGSLLFNHLHKMEKIQALNIQKLTQKLVMLMSLISGGQRAQTIHSIRVSDIKILDNTVSRVIWPFLAR